MEPRQLDPSQGKNSPSETFNGPIATTGRPLLIGRTDTGGNASDYWQGKIDEFSLYNRALTSSEIAALYAAGSAGMCGPDQVPTVVVDLQSISDSGASNTDNLTTNTTPRFDVTINRPGAI